MSRLVFFRHMHGRFHEWKLKKSEEITFRNYLRFPLGKKVFIIGTPDHCNIGDSAITSAEKHLFKQLGVSDNRIKDISLYDLSRYHDIVIKSVKNNIVTYQGGGNMGDIWFDEEQFRRSVVKDLPNKKILFFPQTIHYSETENGEAEKKRSVEFYNRKNCCLVAREETTYDIMKQLYPKAKVLLTPDIVLSTNMSDHGVNKQNRLDVLWCMRSDAEKNMTDEMRNELEKFVISQGEALHKTDMYVDIDLLTKENKAEHVKTKMEEFASSKLVITDRLHGMIFATITETPCVVFGNSNYKISGTYEWIKDLPYVKYVDSVEDAKKYIVEFLKMSDQTFDNSALMPYYEKIKNEILLEMK